MFMNLFRSIKSAISSAAEKFTAGVLNTDQLYAKQAISLMAALIYADNKVEDSEMEAAAALIAADAKIKAQQGTIDKTGNAFDAMTCLAVELSEYEQIAKLPGGGMTGPVGILQIKAKAKRFATEVPKQEDREMIIAQIESIAQADGELAPQEKNIINIFRQAVA